MPDKWGRPTMQDWLGMAQSFQAISNAQTTNLVNQEKLENLQDSQLFDENINKYSAEIMDQGLNAWKPDTKAEGFDPKAAQVAHSRAMSLDQEKMKHDVARHNASYQAIGREAQSGLSKMIASRGESDNPNVPGKITDMKSYRDGYTQLLHSYDLKNDQWDFVKGSIDWDAETVQVKDQQSGKTSTMKIPSENQIKKELKAFYSMTGNTVGTTDKGFQAFLHHGLMTDEDAKRFNKGSLSSGTIYENKDGERLRKTTMVDFRGDGAQKEVWINEQTNEMMPAEIGAKMMKKGKFKTVVERKGELELAEKMSGIKADEALVKQREAAAEYSRSWKKGSGGKGAGPLEKKVKTIAKIHNLTDEQAYAFLREEEQKDKTLNKRLDQYYQQAEFMTEPEDRPALKVLAKDLGVDHIVFGEKEKITVSGGLNMGAETPPRPDAKKAPDGNWYVEKNGTFFKVVQ
jgi:hypothetical protein